MDENAIRQWLIDCFGPIQGEMAWNQFSNMPEELRDQLMSQDPSTLPKPEEVKSMMQAFTAGGLNTMGDMQQAVEQGPINIKLAKSLALQQANGAGSDSSGNAETGEIARRAISEANLWLDTACERRDAAAHPRRLGGGHNRRVGAVRLPRGRIDERRSGFDSVAAFRRRRNPDRDFRGFRRPHRNSDSGRDEESGEADAIRRQHVVRHAVGACRRRPVP